jgi:hypothetical protein
MMETRRNGLSTFVAFVGAALATISTASTSLAQEPATCLSSDPAVWPKSSRPYFMMAMDTSGSMGDAVGVATSCGYGSDRRAHARCAYRNTILAYQGQVNFGLATFAAYQDSCAAACYTNCQYYCTNAELNINGTCAGCGPRPGNATTRAGAIIRVPMQQDNFWGSPPVPSNVGALLQWADNDC